VSEVRELGTLNFCTFVTTRQQDIAISTAESERTQQAKQVKLAAGSMLVAAVVG
jgi:hypothetical protein